jgi:hypothetical protein
MNALKQPPSWLAIAAVMIVGQTSVLFALDPSLAKAASIAVAMLLVSLIVWGSRFAWVIVLIGAGSQLVSSAISTEDYWTLAASAIVFICLLVPPSVRFVWTKQPHRSVEGLQVVVKRPYERLKVSAYGMLAWLAEWENGDPGTNTTHKQRSYRLLIWRLGVACVLLLILVGVTYDWQQGSGHDSLIINVIASVTWTCYAFLQLAFIAISLIALVRHFN